jgi:hypothetical protein
MDINKAISKNIHTILLVFIVRLLRCGSPYIASYARAATP